jgi:SagB-type dehydrogenase family enzyme
MTRAIIVFFIAACAFNLHAQQLTTIRLVTPDKTRGATVMQALNDRQSIREYSPERIRPQDLSDLLWAAYGINRPDGRRTAPSTRNLQSVEMYVIFPEGAYHYNAAQHALDPVAAGDFRAAVASNQDFARTAPLSIVLVADMNKFGNRSENSLLMAAIDVGVISQNISLACAGLGLATVPRGIMDHEALRTALRLTDMHLILLNNPVGYPVR